MTRRTKDNRTRGFQHAFTLIELLVAAVVLVILLGIILIVTRNAGTLISRATVRLDAFSKAHSAFDLVTQRLGQATLNSYYEYFDSQGRSPSDPYYASGAAAAFVPSRYGRQSDLQFRIVQNTQNPGYGQEVYFAAPLAYANATDVSGAPGLLNACGFYVQYVSDATFLPTTVTQASGRYRLMQAIQPSERLLVFPSVAQNDTSWLNDIVNGGAKISRYVSPLADNVCVFAVWPRLAEQDDPVGNQLTADYTYESHPASAGNNSGQPVTQNQLPPVVQVTMVVLSEPAAVRLGGTANLPPSTLEAALVNTDGTHKFVVSTVAQQQADLNDLTAKLTKLRVDYEVFTTSISLREARWGIQTAP